MRPSMNGLFVGMIRILALIGHCPNGTSPQLSEKDLAAAAFKDAIPIHEITCNGRARSVGQTLQAHAPADVKMVCVDLPELDISERDQVQAIVQREAPDVIVNCAAYTAVDLAESAPDVASRVNADGPKILAAASIDTGARLIHISTDFVFNGQASEPYRPESIADPLSVYGDTKWEGERGVRETLPDSSIVLRTSWLYSESGGNFVGTMLRLFGERDEISVVDDQVGSPTWASQ